jgi:hypothetical protein
MGTNIVIFFETGKQKMLLSCFRLLKFEPYCFFVISLPQLCRLNNNLSST